MFKKNVRHMSVFYRLFSCVGMMPVGGECVLGSKCGDTAFELRDMHSSSLWPESTDGKYCSCDMFELTRMSGCDGFCFCFTATQLQRC